MSRASGLRPLETSAWEAVGLYACGASGLERGVLVPALQRFSPGAEECMVKRVGLRVKFR